MARGWHCAKLSLSNARRLSFSGMYVYFANLVPFSLSFLSVYVFLLLSLELGRCSSDLFLFSRPRTGWQPRIVLDMVEARSVVVHINRSGLNHIQYYTWLPSGTWSAEQKEIRGTSTELQ